jgi:sorting nexin-13
VSSPKLISPHSQQPMEVSSPRLNDEQQQQDAVRRAKFVYELMIGNVIFPMHSFFISALLNYYF